MAVADPTLTSPAPLHNPFAALGRRRRTRWFLALLITLLAAGGTAWALRASRAAPGPRFITAPVAAGDVSEAVETTGTVQPIVQVQVSSQVSGRVARVLVDFNSRVRAGDILAELDTAPLRAQLEQAQGALLAAQGNASRSSADFATQEANLARQSTLRAQGLNAVAELEAARGARDAARGARAAAAGAIRQAQAQLASARTNLSFAQIRAPIDGIVITRSVDPGATVAASLQAPTLFVIANDMQRMQVVADVQEAYIGRLSAGLDAEVRVDAFRGEVFRGRVREVRYAPTTVSGVVTYPAVIEVDNPQGRLRPGMTATVTIVTAQREDVLRVPNAALRFRPRVEGQQGAAAGQRGARAGGGAGGAAGWQGRAGAGAGGRAMDPTAGRVFVLRNGAPAPVRVRVGISDGTYTEVTGEGLTAGTPVIVEQTDSPADRAARPQGAAAGSPMTGGGGGARGGGRRGGF